MKLNKVNDLDFDWLEIENRLLKQDGKIHKERMKCIELQFIYIDISGNIKNILRETQKLTLIDKDEFSIFRHEDIQITINTKKNDSEKKYQLLDVFMYNTEIELQNLQIYSQSSHEEDPKRFLKSLSTTSDIIIPKSLFIFHATNSINFLYQEMLPKPILKSKTKKFFLKLHKNGNLKTRKIMASGNQTVIPDII